MRVVTTLRWGALVALLTFVGLVPPLFAQESIREVVPLDAGPYNVTVADSGSCTTTTTGCAMFTTGGFTAVSFQITGTWTGTLQFEMTLDGSNWVATSMTPPNSTTSATNTNANGLWMGNVVGKQFRVRASSLNSGTAVVTLRATMTAKLGGGVIGNVDGPASATDGDLALFDGTTGKLLKDGGVPAPLNATYVTETANSSLTGEFALASLATGILKNTTTTGIPTIAVAGTDYQAPGSYITALTGDVTASGPGSVAATLANTAVTATSYGSSTAISTFTVDSKGRLTAASTVTPQLTLTSTYLSSLSGANLTSLPAANLLISSQATGDTLSASSATVWSRIPIGATGTVYQVAGGLPSWATPTGTGVPVLATAPTFVTSITGPLVIGGTGTTSTLTLRSTSGVGTTGADIIFQAGSNGATEVGRFLNNGHFLLGTTSDSSGYILNVAIPSGSGNTTAISLTHPGASQATVRVANSTTTLQFGVNDSPQFAFFETATNHGIRIRPNAVQGLVVTTSGTVGVGSVTAPTAVLHIAAGTTAASTAPLKFTSGSLLTTAEAGAVEFLTDAFYGTITTGAARKTFAFLESPSFTTQISTPSIVLGSNLGISSTAPTFTSGFGGATGRTMTGTAHSFTIVVGSTSTDNNGVLGLPIATNGWGCHASSQTNPGTMTVNQSASNTTSSTLTQYNTTLGTAANFASGDIIKGSCEPN